MRSKVTNCNGDIIIDGERSLVDTMSEYLNELRKTNEKVVTLEKQGARRKNRRLGRKTFGLRLSSHASQYDSVVFGYDIDTLAQQKSTQWRFYPKTRSNLGQASGIATQLPPYCLEKSLDIQFLFTGFSVLRTSKPSCLTALVGQAHGGNVMPLQPIPLRTTDIVKSNGSLTRYRKSTEPKNVCPHSCEYMATYINRYALTFWCCQNWLQCQ